MGISQNDKKESANAPSGLDGSTSPHTFSTFKLVFFSAITFCLFFLVVEGALWGLGIASPEKVRDPFLGFSTQTKLFSPSPSNNGDATGPQMIIGAEKSHFFQRQSFPLKKAADTRRIFCVGGSTTYGRPYTHQTSFCGWLTDFLNYADPDHKWEVINAGGISYASYRVLLLAEELIQYEPDLIISYMGHNEFLERRTYSRVLGLPKFLRDLGVTASNLRIYALMSELIAPEGNEKEGEEHKFKLDEEVNAILDKSIGPKDYFRDDEQKKKIINHFEINLEKLISLTRSGGAQIIMVAPASKLRNESPFKSQNRSDFDEENLAKWAQFYASAQALFKEKKLDAAFTEISKAEELDPRHAHTLSLKGDILYALAKYPDAKRAYQQARDEDICPLRALTLFHKLTLDTAKKLDVPIVDFNAIMSERASHGITDSKGFLDHVHPTIEGHKILALALLEKIISSGLIRSPRPMTEKAVQEISSTKMSQIDQKEHGNALKNLAMLANWGGKAREGKTLALRAMKLDPTNAMAYYHAGNSAMHLGEDIGETISYFKKATSVVDDAHHIHFTIGNAYIDFGRRGEAMERFQHVVKYGEGWIVANAHMRLGEIFEHRRELRAAIKHYKKATVLDPNLHNARQRLEELFRDHPNLQMAP